MAEFEVERVGGELKRFGVEGAEVPFEVISPYEPAGSQPKAIRREQEILWLEKPRRASAGSGSGCGAGFPSKLER